jgi:hypothetical protein
LRFSDEILTINQDRVLLIRGHTGDPVVKEKPQGRRRAAKAEVHTVSAPLDSLAHD